MNKPLRCLTAILLCLAMICPMIPAYAFGTKDYNSHDVEKLRTFFELTNNMGSTNGSVINGSDYDPDDPATWTCCTWNSSGRLTGISFCDRGAIGNLDLSGCTELITVECYSCRLTGLDLGGCTRVSTLVADHNRISSLNIYDSRYIMVLWLAGNKLSELSVTRQFMVRRLDCGSNNISELNVTKCTQLTYLDCGSNSISELDVSKCPDLTYLDCKHNQLTEIDLSNCTQLENFRSLGNKFRHLDISVINGGESMVLDALGSGYVGTVLNGSSSGYHTLANAQAESGGGFYGWYEGSDLITSSTQFEIFFGEGPRHMTAHFDVYPHQLTINYVYENGTTAAPSYTAMLDQGEIYNVVSPDVSGHLPDIPIVEGVMGYEDVTVTVTYSPITHTLRIYYKYENGTTASRTYSASIAEGASYRVTSPAINYYEPDIPVVTGVMGTQDVTVTVIYYPVMYNLNINYVFEDGTQAAPAYSAQVAYGAGYSVTSPTVQYFSPDIAVVEGVMGGGDVNVTVTYSRNMHTLTIKYIYSEGGTAAPTYTASVGEGLEYSVVSPQISGFRPSREVVSGVMGTYNITVTVTYTRIYHTLSISYVYADGMEAADEYSAQVGEGLSYSVVSPAVQYHTPDIPVVEGVMGTSDIHVIVTYTRNMHTLTINYLFADGSVAAPAYTAEIPEGESYKVVSPAISGYWASQAAVSGVMGASDVTVTVTYTRILHELIISYLFDDGSEAADEYVAQLGEGEGYSVPSPVIPCFTPDMAVVEGVMGMRDVHVTVTYTRNMHGLVIEYLYEGGAQAAPNYSAQIGEGESYSVPSPAITYFTPDISVVEGVMGAGDVNIVVTYHRSMHSLRINYVYPNGSQAAPAYSASVGEGLSYSVASPAVQYYTPDRAVVEGVMGSADITVTVTYYQNIHTLTVRYLYEDGSAAADTYSAQIGEGEGYSVASPVIQFYTPDISVVMGIMGAEDITVTVTYSRNMHTLTVFYVFEDGSEAAPAHVEEVGEGASYRVVSPAVQYHTPDTEAVEGVMGEEDMTVTVTYRSNIRTLTITYIYADGSVAAPAYTAEVPEGESYCVPSPVIPGYNVDIEVVEGVMGGEDVSVTVTYALNIHTVTVYYVFEDGSEAAPAAVINAAEFGSYSIPSPVVPCYTPDMAVVEGVMGTEDLEFTVTYHRNIRSLTVEYVFEDGASAAPAYAAQVPEGESYSVASPAVQYHSPDIAVVEGVMGGEDIAVTVTYHRNMHTLTVKYVDNYGETMLPDHVEEVGEGLFYSVPSPVIEHYTVIPEYVEGVMGAEDITVYVVYVLNTHTLTVSYVFEDGSEAAPAYSDTVIEGEYYCVASPAVQYHTPDIAVVEGEMGAEDIAVTVTYYRNIRSLIITYVYADGSEAAPAYTAEVPEGESYSVPSPVIPGYNVDIEAVEGVMGGEDVSVTVTYALSFHVLTVYYVFEDGSEAAPAAVINVAEFCAYSVPSPAVPGYAPDTAVVEGVMGESDIAVTVTYHRAYHTLTIEYMYEDGSEALPAYTAEIAEGESYSVPSPIIEHHTVVPELVAGVMGTEDITVTVTYTLNVHLLTVYYVYEDGSEAAPAFTAEFAEGDGYSVTSPVIEGYTADIETVEGVMGAEDVTVTVTYTAVPSVMIGDVDGNGVVNSNDALLVLRYVLNIIGPTEQLLLAGDVDGNGVINSNDSLMILRYALGIIQSFPAENN